MPIRTGKYVARETAVFNIAVVRAVIAGHRAVTPRITITVLTTYKTLSRPVSNKSQFMKL